MPSYSPGVPVTLPLAPAIYVQPGVISSAGVLPLVVPYKYAAPGVYVVPTY